MFNSKQTFTEVAIIRSFQSMFSSYLWKLHGTDLVLKVMLPMVGLASDTDVFQEFPEA